MHYVWKILQQDKPDDFVLATNEKHSVAEFLDETLKYCDLELDYQKYLKHNKNLHRPKEVPFLCGDFSKARRILGFEPKIKFKDIIKNMCEHDLKKVSLRRKKE